MARILSRNFKYLPGKQFVRNATLQTIETAKKFRIALIQPESYDTVMNFMIKHFAKDPLSCSLGANVSAEFGEVIKCAWSEELKKGFSLQAISMETNELAGVAINSDRSEAEKPERKNFIVESNCEACRNLFEAWALLDHMSILIPYFEQPKAMFDISGIAVDEKYGGLGIAKALIRHSMNMAICHGFKVAKMDSTSDYSARAADSAGFHRIYEKPFQHFRGIKEIKKPHIFARVHARFLEGLLM